MAAEKKVFDETTRMVTMMDNGQPCHECYFYSFVDNRTVDTRCCGCREEDEPAVFAMSFTQWQQATTRREFKTCSFDEFTTKIYVIRCITRENLTRRSQVKCDVSNTDTKN